MTPVACVLPCRLGRFVFMVGLALIIANGTIALMEPLTPLFLSQRVRTEPSPRPPRALRQAPT